MKTKNSGRRPAGLALHALLLAGVSIFILLPSTLRAEGGLVVPSGPPGVTECPLGQICSNQVPSTPITNAGFVITNSGHYHLPKSIYQAGTDGIIINADNVEIDFEGFSLSGNGDNYSGVVVIGSHTNIVLKHGFIIDYSKYVINAPAASGLVVDRIGSGLLHLAIGGIVSGSRTDMSRVLVIGNGTATNPAVQVGPGSVVSDCQVSNWGSNAAAICIATGDDCRVERCLTSGGYTGILCGNHCLIQDCQSYSNVNHGISCQGGSVYRCSARVCASGAGFSVNACNLSYASATACSNGFVCGANVNLAECRASSNANAGFSAGAGCSFRDCTADNNGGDGFAATQMSVLKGCQATMNGMSGAHLLGHGNLVTGSFFASNNTSLTATNAGVRVDGNANVIKDSFAYGNGLFGFAVNASNLNNFLVNLFGASNGATFASSISASNGPNVVTQITTVGNSPSVDSSFVR
ncbi:MAG: hypothetical protein HY301_20150 [Verrucomicrobia bacterium]|nr:hypothetical protein [Verrucomicrobiota bacterium]